MGVKQYFINKLTNFLVTRKAIKNITEENRQLMSLLAKEDQESKKNVYNVDIPNVNTPFDLIEFDEVKEFTIIDESVIIVTLPYERLVLTIEDDIYLLQFLKRCLTYSGEQYCGVSIVGRERMLLSKTLEFYLSVDLNQTIDVVALRDAVYNATWHIEEEKKTFDWYTTIPEERY